MKESILDSLLNEIEADKSKTILDNGALMKNIEQLKKQKISSLNEVFCMTATQNGDVVIIPKQI